MYDIRHCNDCNHEWQSIKGDKYDIICDWCGGESHIILRRYEPGDKSRVLIKEQKCNT